MARTILNDDTWQQLQSIMTEKGCYSTENNRNVMEAILWKLRTGAPWRDIPERLCPWKTAYNRFNRWSANGLWDNFFELRGKTDQEWVSIDGSYVSAHQHVTGAQRGEDRAIGRGRGGATTKIHMAVDSHGRPIDFEITGGG